MTTALAERCEHAQLVSVHALHLLESNAAAAMEAHLTACPECTREMDRLRPILDAFGVHSIELRPALTLWGRLTVRIAAESGSEPVIPAATQWAEPEWEEPAPGISCKLLATDMEHNRLTMLVRLAPGAEYPPHTHAGVEELHLLQGELWIDERKLYPGDYNHAEPGTSDRRVWSETGCTCVLITSPGDVLR